MLSTSGQLTEFFENSNIWKDICKELDTWLEKIHENLEVCPPDLIQVHQGSAIAIRHFKNISEAMISIARDPDTTERLHERHDARKRTHQRVRSDGAGSGV